MFKSPNRSLCMCAYVFRYRGEMAVAMVMGGVDASGSHLYCVHPHGSADRLPFASMGTARYDSVHTVLLS